VKKIDETLAERESTYGDFANVAEVSQFIKNNMSSGRNWEFMPAHQKESLEMIASKIARIVCGDSNHHDSWHDIGGYAKLVADRLL
jgi:hypothetical protein